ncbi:proteoglycan 4-like [Anopheles ziemanni]|uniref:proteoglycan 4-like n=1 Tax=Anopheles coustani TaxID=139045 RepID=UPI0026585744|nr:proteoglycan 4-like [Anopheles coustani]XP_058174079.1 proteoglycan 4-like [Anopheles ziemanni]
MGLKLKWFRRRITFDGIPPAPERSIRRKEAASGTVTGVYRQSTNFEDYIEPVRTSFWEPPPQAIARATYRTSNPTNTTSTNGPSSSSLSMTRGGTIVASTNSIKAPPAVVPLPVPTTISSVSRPQPTTSTDTEDKIGGRTGNGALRHDTPPEPTYTPPQPPVRKGLVGKAKSLGNLANATSPTSSGGSERFPRDDGNSSDDSTSGYVTSYELRSPRSVEVLSGPTPPRTPKPDAPARVPPVTAIPRTTSSNSLPSKGDSAPVSPPAQRKPVEVEPDYIVPLAPEDPEPIYDSFDAIFERVKVRKPASPVSQRSAPSTPSTPSPPTPRQKESPRARVVATSVPNPAQSPPQPKSILKKRAPAPPAVVEAMSSMVVDPVSEPVMTIPTPPPRSTRGAPTSKDVPEAIPEPVKVTIQSPRKEEDIQMIPQVAHSVDHNQTTDDDSDEDFNWDFVQRHRSSINQTMAAQTQIDPEVLRNAPASLLQGPSSTAPSQYTRNPSEPVAQPRTLRGMRNQRARPQEAEPINRDDRSAVAKPQTTRARASDSNCSETSA